MAAPMKSTMTFAKCMFLSNNNKYIISNSIKPLFFKRRNVLSNRKLSTLKMDSFSYCMDLVRKHDHENFLCTLLLPTKYRSSAFVIRAFNVELAQIRDLISTPAIGYMRIQFWKDSLNKTFMGQPPPQPVAKELAKILEKQKLSKLWFHRLISCREEILTDKGFLTIEELEEYCESSVSSVYFLILQAMGIQDIHCDHAASHLGKAQGITNLLRGIPFNASNGRVYLPLEIMSKYKISQEGLVQGTQQKELCDAVFDLASVAHHHLQLARSFHKNVPKYIRPVFLPAVPTSSFLKMLQHTGFDIFNPKNQVRNVWLPVSLISHKIRKTY